MSRVGKFVAGLAEGTEAELEALTLQGLTGDAENLGGLALVTGGHLEHPRDVAPLQGIEVEGLGGGLLGRSAEERTHEVGVDVPLGEGDGALDEVLELTHVAREVVGDDEGQGL